jgi:hypothetical protein
MIRGSELADEDLVLYVAGYNDSAAGDSRFQEPEGSARRR